MSFVPAGKLRPGWEAGDAAEEPGTVLEGAVPAFCMDTTEVTASAYAGCVAAGACRARTSVEAPGAEPAWRALHSEQCNYGTPRTTHPMNCVSWDDAAAYCRWAGKRLPSAELWEYAARGSDGRPYPWGSEPAGPRRLNACGKECAAALHKLEVERGVATPHGMEPMFPGSDGWLATAPVGSFPQGRSPFGLEDMAGNVAEWTASAGPPLSPSSDEPSHIVRGGSWDVSSAAPDSPVHPGRGSLLAATSRLDTVGFRCLR